MADFTHIFPTPRVDFTHQTGTPVVDFTHNPVSETPEFVHQAMSPLAEFDHLRQSVMMSLEHGGVIPCRGVDLNLDFAIDTNGDFMIGSEWLTKQLKNGSY